MSVTRPLEAGRPPALAAPAEAASAPLVARGPLPRSLLVTYGLPRAASGLVGLPVVA